MAASGGPNTAQAFAPNTLKIYTAPFGTTMPVDATVALASTWWDYGYLAEEGQTFDEDRTIFQQFEFGGTLVREIVQRRVYTIAGNLLQLNSNVLQVTNGGGAVGVSGSLATYTPPTGRTNTPFAAILEWVDGANAHRILAPKVTSATGASRPFGQGVLQTPLRLTITATLGIAPYTEITNDVVNFPIAA